MDTRSTEKKERLEKALDQGMVMIHLDARRPCVEVPEHLRGEAHLRLNLSYRFVPSDLTVNEGGIRSTLSFSGERFCVFVPWGALFAINSHTTKEFWMYPDDMPPELIQTPPPTTAAAASESARVSLKSLEGDGKQQAPSDENPTPPRRSHLRVVK